MTQSFPKTKEVSEAEMVIEETPLANTAPPTYQPGKTYTWEPTSEFKITGAEFNLMYKNLQDFVNGSSTDVKTVLKVTDCLGIAQTIMEREIGNMNIKEATPPEEN